MFSRVRVSSLCLALAAGAIFVVTASAQAPDVQVSDAWVREAPSGRPNTAAFMTITNPTAHDVVILSATSPAARTVELHEMRDDNGVMRMRKVDKYVVPAKGTLLLKPGGLHIMMFDLTKALEPGATVKLTLQVAGGGSVDVEAPVRGRPGSE